MSITIRKEHGAPNTNTVGFVGEIYEDLNTGNRFKCTGIYKTTGSKMYGPDCDYHWEKIDMIEPERLPKIVTSYNDLEDKPFYAETKESVEYLFKDVVKDTYDGYSMGMYTFNNISGMDIRAFNSSDTNVLVIDGVDYILDGGFYSNETSTRIYHDYQFNNELNQSYRFQVDVGSGGIYKLTLVYTNVNFDDSIPHTFSIYRIKKETTVTPIDKMFLPEDIILPSVTSEDEGKILKVVNGKWTAVAAE